MFYGERRSSVTLNYKTAISISNFIVFFLISKIGHIAIQIFFYSEEMPDCNVLTYINYHVHYLTVICYLY